MEYNKVALIGMMGSGKSTIAKQLNKITNIKLFETDEIFENKYKLTIKKYFDIYGENNFREKENEILVDIVKNEEFIISTGGGVVLNSNNREILFCGNIKTIYLKTSCNSIFERIKNDKSRPLLLVDDPKDEIKKILNDREKFYNMADIVVQTDNKDIYEITKEICEKLWKKYI